jgi:hypothetical protein
VTEDVIEILAPHLRRGGEARVREAMQAVIGILTDAVISESPPMEPGTRRINEALSEVFVEIAGRGGKPSPKSKEGGRSNKKKGDNSDIAESKSSSKTPPRREITAI